METPHDCQLPLIFMSTGESTSQGDHALLRRIASGDVEAFSAFYDRAAGLMYSVAHRILGTDDDAAAGVQAAFTAVWNDAARLTSNSVSPLAWAVGLTRRACLDQLAKRRSQNSAEGQSPAEVSKDTNRSSASSKASEDGPDATTGWAGMPTHQRQALELAFFGGLSQPEISQRLGLPSETTKTCIAAGLRQLHASSGQFKLETKSADAWPAK